MTEQELALLAKDQWKALDALARKFAEGAPIVNQLMWEDAQKAFLLDFVQAFFRCAPFPGRLLPAYKVVFHYAPFGPGSEHVERAELCDTTWDLEPRAPNSVFDWSVFPLKEIFTPEELIERVASHLTEFHKRLESERRGSSLP
jgi:hypothetical protein